MATDQEYTEPTNTQLANFLTVYVKQIPGMQHMQLNPVILETMLCNPEYRAAALRHHREFQAKINRLHQKMEEGQLQCQHIRPNGKSCPNFNTPGTFYCGLHQHVDDE